MTEILGRNVLITGAASGIGRRLAERMGDEGGRLVLWDVDEAALKTAAGDLEQRGVEVRTDVCDVTDRGAVRATAERVLREQGPIDILVNNAGVVSGRPLLELSDEDIERTLRVNLMSLFWVTRAFLPRMIERDRGHIVTIASAAGLAGVSRLTDYCASKFGAVGFDEALRLELRREGRSVRTTIVCPFYIRTGMFEGVQTRFSWLLPILETDQVVDRILRAIHRNHRRVLMPRFLYSVWLTRLLPVSVFDALLGVLGVNRSMDEFIGRGSRGSSKTV